MNPSNDLIRAIVDEDFVSAKELTNNLIFTAVADVLDDAKREVAAELFSECETCGDDVSEAKMSANRYGGGKPFNWNKPHPSNARKPKKKKGLKGNKSEIDANKNGKDDVSEAKMSTNRYGGGKPFNWNKPHPSLAKKDFDGDGKVETPKDEVHGSHVNAAVEAGRLTPTQASRTKNKGKY